VLSKKDYLFLIFQALSLELKIYDRDKQNMTHKKEEGMGVLWNCFLS